MLGSYEVNNINEDENSKSNRNRYKAIAVSFSIQFHGGVY